MAPFRFAGGFRSVVPTLDEQVAGPTLASLEKQPPRAGQRYLGVEMAESSDNIFRDFSMAADIMSPEDMRAGNEPSDKYVTITFGDDMMDPVMEDDADFGLGMVTPQNSMPEDINDRDARLWDLYVGKRWFVCSVFARYTDGSIDERMESKFAWSKDLRFCGAFARVSFLMMAGTLGLAAFTGLSGDWLRACVYACVIAPPYGLYGCLACHCRKKHQAVAKSWLEPMIVSLFGMQGLAIILSEWLRPKIDYGMLVMHIGFIHNFTPFKDVALHLVTVISCFMPYVMVKWVRYKDPTLGRFSDDSEENAYGSCGGRVISAEAQMLLDTIMPAVILLSQAISTSRRDWSMREDALVTEQLRAQRQLLKVEKKRCEDLLRSMLPKQIIASALGNEPVAPQLFPDVTVIFIEICNFNNLCARLKPCTVVEVLNIIYHEFDRLSDLLDVYKVETVAEVYMAVVGCPELITNHADVAAHFALACQQSMLHMRGQLNDIMLESDSGSFTSEDSGSTPSSWGGAESSGSDSQGTPQPPPPLPDTVLPPDSQPADGPTEPPDLEEGRENGAERQQQQQQQSPLTEPQPPQQQQQQQHGSARPPEQEDGLPELLVRIGLNSGQVRAGVVGLSAPRYKLVGDTVNTASRMESTCAPGRVQVSPSTRERLSDTLFEVEARGEIKVKGKGTIQTSFLNGYSEDQGDEMPTERTVLIKRQANEENGNGNSDGAMTGIGNNSSWNGALASVESSARALKELEEPTTPATSLAKEVPSMLSRRCDQFLDHLLLLAPALQIHPDGMVLLKEDLMRFVEEMLPMRVYSARVLTLSWLFIVTLISVLDCFLQANSTSDVLQTLLIRSLFNDMVGLVYLFVLAQEDIFSRCAQVWTGIMLIVQGSALVVGGSTLFQHEPSLVALYGICVLFYSVCTIWQRLSICALAVFGFVVTELLQCWDSESVGRMLDMLILNVGFLCILFVFLACSVRLEELLGHVANYDHCLQDRQLEKREQTKSASSRLLSSLLPEHVARLVLEGVSPIADPCRDVTMLFTDIKGFTAYSSGVTPQELVDVLNSMYSAFDEIIVSWELYKVEIIGDAYFVTGGVPPARENTEDPVQPEEYAMRAVEVGLAMQRTLPVLPWGSGGTQLEMRVGIHTGSVVAGVVGKKGPRYHVFGSAVGYASQMESSGQPGRVHISHDTYEHLQNGGYQYDFEEEWVELDGEPEKQRTWHVHKSKDRAAHRIQTKLMQQRATRRGRTIAQAQAAELAMKHATPAHAVAGRQNQRSPSGRPFSPPMIS